MPGAPEGLRPAAAHWPVIGPRDPETRALIGRESGVGQLQRCTDIANTRLQKSPHTFLDLNIYLAHTYILLQLKHVPNMYVVRKLFDL